MKGIWAGSLGLSLGLFASGVRADDAAWRPVAPAATVPVAGVTLGRPVVGLGRPVPLGAGERPAAVVSLARPQPLGQVAPARPAMLDSAILTASFSPSVGAPLVVRG